MTNDNAHPTPYTEEDDHVDAKTEAKHLTPEKEIKRQNTEEDHAAPQPRAGKPCPGRTAASLLRAALRRAVYLGRDCGHAGELSRCS